MLFPGDGAGVSEGRLQRRRWSPDVARRSVDCFWDDGGSQSKRVTGYECVASAILVNSKPYFGAPGVYDSEGVGVILESSIWICQRIVSILFPNNIALRIIE